jgi:GT2 family glycosyltransferase
MTFAVAMPSIAAPDALIQTVAAVKDQTVDTDVLVVQNGRTVGEACAQLEKEGVTIYRPGENLGCTGSWNYACRWAWEKGYDKVMLLNDDFIIQDQQGLQYIIDAIEENPMAHYHFAGFTSVCIRKELWDMVGEFDEGFWPAYYEDNDYYMRSILLGIEWKIVDVKWFHYGSLSLRRSPNLNMLNTRSFPLNKKRYLAKWGGLPTEETFLIPWNGGEPLPGVKELLRQMGWNNWYDY